MSWIIPANKLDAQQNDFINNVDIYRQNVWIKGFPGSGKSVLLAYTLKKIKAIDSKASILIVVYTHSLIKMFEAAFAEMAIFVEIVTFYDFMKSTRHYDYILSDEVQDLTPSVLKEMKKRAKHIVVAGDSNQSIFEMDPKYKEPVVDPSQINFLLDSRGFELGIIHRLSRSIINAIQKLLPMTNIFGAKRDLSKEDTQVRLCEATSNEEEVNYILKYAEKAINIGDTVAILIPSQASILFFIQNVIKLKGKKAWDVKLNIYGKTDYSSLNTYLEVNGIPLQYVGNGYGQFSNEKKICIMTYHSSKGLDFDNVFLPFLNKSFFIVSNEAKSKTLFMVAMTRSRKNLYLTYNGYQHAYLKDFASDCNHINIHDVLSSQTSTTSKSGNNTSGNNIFAGF